MSTTGENAEELSASAKIRIEKNRQKALAIRQSKLISHPYAKKSEAATAVSINKTTIQIGNTKYKDTGGGFLLEEAPIPEQELLEIVAGAPPVLESDRPNCENCDKPIAVSWLFDNFDYNCCDECKDPETHKLITKTEALNTYLLKDYDLDKREPALKFITRKNPHNVRWGDMKLYLQIQVAKRALEVWGDAEKIEEEREKREEKKVLSKSKKYHKQLKELRMNMRSSLYDRTSSVHSHEFGPEIYNEEDDNYTRSCQTCSYQETFEKM